MFLDQRVSLFVVLVVVFVILLLPFITFSWDVQWSQMAFGAIVALAVVVIAAQ